MNWKNTFNTIKSGTKVQIEVTYATVADLEKIVEMGFEEGFSAGHSNLDEYLMSRS